MRGGVRKRTAEAQDVMHFCTITFWHLTGSRGADAGLLHGQLGCSRHKAYKPKYLTVP